MDMKHFLIATTALLVVVPDVALAYQTNQQAPTTRPTRTGNAQRPSSPAKVQRPAVRPTRPTQVQRPAVRPTRPAQVQRPAVRPTRPAQVQRPNRPSVQPTRPVQRPYVRPPTYRPGQTRPSSFRRIHRPTYNYPRGYSYRRFNIGFILPRLFFANQYYFYDYYALGVGPPPPGYIWVRYGPDLLLVQRRTGRVVDVIYGAFY